jgi:iron complex outermembrane receptor protein
MQFRLQAGEGEAVIMTASIKLRTRGGGATWVLALAALACTSAPAAAQQAPLQKGATNASEGPSFDPAAEPPQGGIAAEAPGGAIVTGASANSGTEPSSEIVVTGSRLARSGFTTPTPVTVIGQERMQRLGITNIADALNQVPAFRATTTPASNGLSAQTAGANLADLRGLGASRTLVLVDGRRFVPTTATGSVDLNLVPTMLIARSEVVTGGASAAYGSDALAGVVNLILDQTIDGVRAQASYGETDRGDGKHYQASLAAGAYFANQRGHLSFGFDYDDAGRVGDCYTRDWCRAEYGVVSNANRGTNGFPAFNVSPNVHTTFTPGGLITSGPLRGTQFLANGTPAPFAYGQLAGAMYQIGGDAFGNTLFDNILLSIPVKRQTVLGHANYELSDAVSGFIEGSYGHVDAQVVNVFSRDVGTLTVRRDNAFLPAATAAAMDAARVASITLGRINKDLGNTLTDSENETWRVVGGLNGKLGASWKWSTYYQYGVNKNDKQLDNNRISANYTLAIDAVRSPATGEIVCRSALTNPSTACRPFNLFGENQFSDAARAYVTGQARTVLRTQQHVVSADLQGNLFTLPGGVASIALGGEYRKDSASGTADPIVAANGFYVNVPVPPRGVVNVKEAFVETELPLLSDRRFARSLELNGAARITDYSTSGQVTTWKVGGVWEPFDFLRLRATRSRDIRAPNVTELFTGQAALFGSVVDPVTRFDGLTTVYSGGNPNLRPEKADTLTLGAVIAPKTGGLRGLRISADYYDIKVVDAIGTLGGQTVLDRCAAGANDLCSLVSRNAGGQLVSISNVYLNLNRVTTSGLDGEMAYALPLENLSSRLNGTLDMRLLGNYVFDLTTVDAGGSLDRAGQTGITATGAPGIARWTADAILTYSTPAWSLTAQGHYVAKGTFQANYIEPGDAGYSPFLANSINDNSVPSRFYLNLAGQVRVFKSSRANVELFGVVNNVFDRNPPNFPGVLSTNAIYFDAIGRTYRGGIRVRY